MTTNSDHDEELQEQDLNLILLDRPSFLELEHCAAMKKRTCPTSRDVSIIFDIAFA